MRSKVLAFVIAFSSLLSAPVYGQQSLNGLYTFQKFEYPGATISFPIGINNLRQIVGFWYDNNFVPHGYVWTAGKFTTIDYPSTPAAPVTGTITPGINDRGDIVGLYFDANGYQHGFTFRRPDGCPATATDETPGCKGIYKPLDVPGATQVMGGEFEFGPGLGSAAFGTNNLRQVVGEFGTQNQSSNGFLEQNGEFTVINNPLSSHIPGEDGTKCLGVSNFGVMACNYLTQAYAGAGSITHGFLRRGSVDIPVEFPGSPNYGFGTQVSGVNSLNVAVGIYGDKAGYNGFIWVDGRFFTLNFPGMPYSELHSINDRGDVTGAFATDAEGENLFGYVAFSKL